MKVALVVLFGKEKKWDILHGQMQEKKNIPIENERFSSRDILGYDLKERLSGSENRIAISECL